MNVYVLIENTTDSALASEHGLSLFIEYDGKKILLDAGATSTFMDNAIKMNVDIANADFCVLSHGHYDHSGGLAEYFCRYPNKKVYAMESAVDEYYSGSGGCIHEIGIPKTVYPAHKKKFVFVTKVTEISKGIYVVPHSTEGLGEIGQRAKLYKKMDGEYIPDDFSHEMSLVIDTKKGLIVFNSCSHSGIVNILKEVKTYFGDKKIYAFFGGLHMKGKDGDKEICIFSDDEISEMTKHVKSIGLNKLYTGHCTGIVGYKIIKQYMGNSAEYICAGRVIEV